MGKDKICISKRQIFVVSLIFIIGCFVVLINFISKSKLYTQSRASEGNSLSFSPVAKPSSDGYPYLTNCTEYPNSSRCTDQCNKKTDSIAYACATKGEGVYLYCCEMPLCTVTVGSGWNGNDVYNLLFNTNKLYVVNHTLQNIPSGITHLNINTEVREISTLSNLTPGDVVSLLPENKFPSCKGIYLGGAQITYFDSYVVENKNGGKYYEGRAYAAGEEMTLEKATGVLKKVCDALEYPNNYNTYIDLNIDCNITVVVKTSSYVYESSPNTPKKYLNSCKTFSRAGDALAAFEKGEFGPLMGIKSYAVAMFWPDRVSKDGAYSEFCTP